MSPYVSIYHLHIWSLLVRSSGAPPSHNLQGLGRYSTFKWSLKISPRTFEIFQTTMLQTGGAQHHRTSPKTVGEAPTSTAKPFRSQMPTDAAMYWKIFVPTLPGMVGKNECPGPVTRVLSRSTGSFLASNLGLKKLREFTRINRE